MFLIEKREDWDKHHFARIILLNKKHMVEKSQTEMEKEEKRNKNEEFRRKRQCIYINKMNGLWKIYEKKWMDFEKNMNEKKK